MHNLWVLLGVILGFATQRLINSKSSGYGNVIIRKSKTECLHIHHWMWLMPLVAILTFVILILNCVEHKKKTQDEKYQICETSQNVLVIIDAYFLGYLLTGFCYSDFAKISKKCYFNHTP